MSNEGREGLTDAAGVALGIGIVAIAIRDLGEVTEDWLAMGGLDRTPWGGPCKREEEEDRGAGGAVWLR